MKFLFPLSMGSISYSNGPILDPVLGGGSAVDEAGKTGHCWEVLTQTSGRVPSIRNWFPKIE